MVLVRDRLSVSKSSLAWVLWFGKIFYQGFHDFAGFEVEGEIAARGGEKVGPFKDFSEVKLMEGKDNSIDGWFGANDKNFNRLPI